MVMVKCPLSVWQVDTWHDYNCHFIHTHTLSTHMVQKSSTLNVKNDVETGCLQKGETWRNRKQCHVKNVFMSTESCHKVKIYDRPVTSDVDGARPADGLAG